MIPKSFLEHVLFSTLRIQLIDEQGNENGIGTGFLIKADIGRDDLSTILLITNKHVLKDSPKFRINFHHKRKNLNEPDLGKVFPFLALGYDLAYTEHADSNIDLACINISDIIQKNSDKIYFQAMDTNILSDFNEKYLDVGNRVIFVGYPENRFDEEHNLPIVRTGITASHPKIDFNKIPQFLIDAQVFFGSSGSPVFLDLNDARFSQGEIIFVDGQPNYKLIGVVSATMIKNNIIKHIETKTIDIAQEVIGLGIVFKSTALKELIDIALNNLHSSGFPE